MVALTENKHLATPNQSKGSIEATYACSLNICEGLGLFNLQSMNSAINFYQTLSFTQLTWTHLIGATINSSPTSGFPNGV